MTTCLWQRNNFYLKTCLIFAAKVRWHSQLRHSCAKSLFCLTWRIMFFFYSDNGSKNKIIKYGTFQGLIWARPYGVSWIILSTHWIRTSLRDWLEMNLREAGSSILNSSLFFFKTHAAVLEKKSKLLKICGRHTEGRTDWRLRRVITIAHLSLFSRVR